MITFDITHTDLKGVAINYEGIYKDSIEAIQDCIKNFGFGKVKVVRKERQESDEKL